MQCTQCGAENDPTYRFCLKCGGILSESEPEAQTIVSQAPIDAEVPVQPSAVQSMPSTPPPSPVQPQHHQPVASHQQYQQPPSASQVGRAALDYGKQGMSVLNIWGPFAGYGSRRQHVGWLMDNRGDRAKDLINKVNSNFRERKIPGTAISHQNLVAKGVYVENRPYFILKRGLVSLGLHIGQFGRDLFISMASYLKPPISVFRVIVLGIMVLFWLYMTFIFPNSLDKAISGLLSGFNLFGGNASGGGDSLFSLLCVIGPLGTLNNIAIFLFVVFSIYKWVSEKDILAGLRVSPNEFNEDDLMAMEKAVEQTVRLSLDEIGLDPDDLKPTESYSGRRLI